MIETSGVIEKEQGKRVILIQELFMYQKKDQKQKE